LRIEAVEMQNFGFIEKFELKLITLYFNAIGLRDFKWAIAVFANWVMMPSLFEK
jgi:hypothetical protein